MTMKSWLITLVAEFKMISQYEGRIFLYLKKVLCISDK